MAGDDYDVLMVESRYLQRILPFVVLIGASPGQDAVALVRDGVARAERGEFRAALRPLSSALSQEPDNVEARRWRGHCYNALGMYTQAIDDYDQALRIDAKFAWAWYARGMARHHLDQLQAAIADYSQALALDSGHAKAVEWRGHTRARIGDHLGAYLDFKRAEELDPQNPRVFLARGKSLASLGDLRRARIDFQAASKLDPKDPSPHAQIGFLEVALGDQAAALKSFDRAYDLDPRGGDYARLWRYWLRATSGKLSDRPRDELPGKKWTGELARVLLGELTKSQILSRFPTHRFDEAKTSRSYRCEASFYLGLRALLVDHPNRARERFRDALVKGDETLPEWRAARRLARVK